MCLLNCAVRSAREPGLNGPTRHRSGDGVGGGGGGSNSAGPGLPMGGAGLKSGPIAGIVARSVDTAVEPLRQALIKRGEDGQTGIDEQGRVKAFEMDDQRLKCLGCRLCTPDKNDGSRHKDRLRAAWSLMAYRNHNS